MIIDILMATYNGEKYIEAQLLSLQSQTYKEWNLLIHDDGSTDNTVEIIQKYTKLDHRITFICDENHHLGASMNFMNLLKYSTSDFIMFCDQDDIWLEDKIEKMLFEIKNKNNSIPQLVYSKAYLLYNSHVINDTVLFAEVSSLSNLLFLNGGILGCTIICNKKLLSYCLDYSGYVSMHDVLLCLVASTLGEISYISDRLILYRQHENNVTGNVSSSFFRKIKTFFKRDKVVIRRKYYLTVEGFYKHFGKDMSSINKDIINSYLSFPKKNIFNRITLVYKYKFKIFDSITILLIKILFRKPIN